jgi:hypothetical protein
MAKGGTYSVIGTGDTPGVAKANARIKLQREIKDGAAHGYRQVGRPHFAPARKVGPEYKVVATHNYAGSR